MTAQVLPLFGQEAPQPAFERFWKIYPRRPNQSKKEARDAWARLMKAGHDPERIIRAAEIFAASIDCEPRYIKHACRWLKNECFEDILEEREVTQQDNAGRDERRKRQMADCVKRCRAMGLSSLPRHITAHDVLVLEMEGYLCNT